MIKFLRKYHKWLGVILTIFILFFAVSGIILNHRDLFSPIEVSRRYLPEEYRYYNWNNAAVKGTLQTSDNEILIYGNIGIWKTDTAFSGFSDFNRGFPKGIDNRKICKIFKDSNERLLAGTLFGLFVYDEQSNAWQKIEIPVQNKRVTDILEKDDTLYILTRSFILKTNDLKHFEKIILPAPENYDNKIGLFKTLWFIHSGKIYGETGKLVVDLIGITFIFLSITGLILFINKYVIKKRKKQGKDFKSLSRSNKWNLKWHNKIGWIATVFLIITTLTGMFLRPPLLIPIANKKVSKIPYTKLDSENAWFDKLRRIIYDKKNKRYIIATNERVYYSDDNFKSYLKVHEQQPPISVMGVNVFEQKNDTEILIGSFEGLFLWNIKTGYIEDYIEKKKYQKPLTRGSPIGKYLITGYTDLYKRTQIYFDYNTGANSINSMVKFVNMPENIKAQPMSLWNVALEFHTMRIFQSVIGVFYTLIIPLSGLSILFILVSGFIIWYKKHRKK